MKITVTCLKNNTVGSHPKLTTKPATSSTSIQMLFVFPGLTYMTTDQKDQSFPGLLET